MPLLSAIKHYQIVCLLGEGGFGEVYEAWDKKLQRNVAIKCLKGGGLLSLSEDLIREARMAASLNHPAFVKIHALEDDDDSQAIVMELIKGETLKQVVTNNQPGLYQAINIIRQIAEAMQQAHDLGLTHGDLKPSNVMLEASGSVRILDFGLASKVDMQATTSMVEQDPQGTIAYMAPERLLGEPLAPQVDVYALGVIFYELLNGQRPFAELGGLALAAALVQSSSDQWCYRCAFSPSAINLIRRMTAKQPSHRLSSMTEILIELDNVENSTPLTDASLISDKNSPVTKHILSPKKQQATYFNNAIWLIGVVTACVVFGGWLTRNVLWNFEEIIPRYSETREMQLGMDALDQWDRPGSLDFAIKHFNNLVGQNPKNASAIAGLSIAYSLKYSSDATDSLWLKNASVAAQQSLAINNQLALSSIAMGRMYFAQGKYEPALEYFQSARMLDPGNLFSWYGVIDSLYRMKQYDEAIRLAETCMQKFPTSRVFADQLGLIYTALGNFSEAEKFFRKSITIQPDSVFSYASLGAILHLENHNDEAKHILQQGLQIRPSSWLYTNLGNIYFAQGDYINAAAAFESAVKPELGSSSDYIAWANLADTLQWIPGRKGEAKKYYKKAYELLSNIPGMEKMDMTLSSNLALYGARIEKRDESKALLGNILTNQDLAADVYFRAALTYEILQERTLALEQIRNAYTRGFPLYLIEAEPDLASLRHDANYDLR